jgi:hypothetical protein
MSAKREKRLIVLRTLAARDGRAPPKCRFLFTTLRLSIAIA